MSLERRLAVAFLDGHPSEAALALERLSPDQRAAIVREAPAHTAAAIGRMTPSSAAECLARLSAEEVVPVLERLPLGAVISLLRQLPEATAERLLGGLTEATRDAVRRSLRYPPGTAGALMDPAVLSLPDDITVAEARIRLRRATQGVLYYLYVVNREGRLVGVLDIPELARADAREQIRSVMHERAEHLPAWMPAAAVRSHSGWRSFHAMPVIDEQGRFLGAIRYQTLRRLEREAGRGADAQPISLTIGALGELFHLGMAGFIEGVVAAAGPRAGAAEGIAPADGGAR